MRINIKVSVLALAMGLAAGSAQAQTVAADSQTEEAGADSALGEIIVTARRQEERLQNVPVAITALGKDFIEKHAIQSVTELANFVPGMKTEQFLSPEQFVVSFRGQRSSNILPGIDPAVGLYINEVPYSLQVGASQQFYDLESIQALKGPQGTLFGQSTTGGAVLFTTAKPRHEYESAVTLGGKTFNGNYGAYGTVMLNLPVNEKVAVRVAVNGVFREGYIKNKGPFPPLVTLPQGRPNSAGAGDLQDDRQINARFSLLLNSTEAIENLTVATYGKLWSNGPGLHWTGYNPNSFINFVYGGLFGFDVQGIFDQQQEMYRKNFWTTQSAVDAYTRVESYGLTNITNIDLSDAVRLRNIANYREFSRDQISSLSGGPLNFIDAVQPYTGREMSEEVQLQGKAIGDRLDYTVGYFFFEQRTHVQNGAMVLNGSTADYYGNNVARSNAVYAQGTFGLTDRLSLTAGGRYTWDYRRIRLNGISRYQPNTCHITGANGSPLPADERCQLGNQVSYKTPTWTVSLNYQANPDTLLYLAHRRGYRAGGVSLYANQVVANVPFKPEKVTDVEFGVKRDWHFGGDAFLRTNLATYYSKYKNAIRNTSLPGGDPSLILLVNATGANIYGGELETMLVPFKGLTLTGNAAYVHANFGDFVTAQGDATGNRFANVPRWQLSGGVRYAFPDSGNGEISLAADWNRQSSVWFDDETQTPGTNGPLASLQQKSYDLVNLRLDWTRILGGKIDGSIYVTNLTKTEYLVGNSIQLYGSLGYNAQTPGDPRVFGLELRYRY